MIKKISGNIIIFGGLNAVKSIIPIIMLPFLTTYLTADEFGALALIDSTVLFLVPLIMVGISSSFSVNYHKLDSLDYASYISNGFAISSVIFIFLSVFSIIFKSQLDHLIGFNGNIVYFLALFAFLRVCSAAILAILQTTQSLKAYSFLVIVQSILDIVLSMLLLVTISYGMNGRLFAIYSAFALSILVGFIYLRHKKYFAKVNFKHSADILRFGIPLIPHAISGAIMAMADRFFIAHYLGNEHVAGYVVAYQMAALMLLFGTSINQAWTPIYFDMMKRDQAIKIKKIKISLSLLLFISGMIIYGSKDFLFYIFVDEKFWFAKDFFPFMLLGFIFQSLYFIYANYFFYIKKTKFIAIFTMFGAIVNLILNYFFIKPYGVVGVAYVNAITWGIFLVLVFISSNTMSRKVRNV